MGDQNSGLQPVGGLAPVGGLKPVGGDRSVSDADGRVLGPGESASAKLPGAPARPVLREPEKPAAKDAPLASASFSTSVFVPQRDPNAEVWREPGFDFRKLWLGLGGVVVAGLAIGAYCVCRPPAPAVPPTSYKEFTSGDKSWAFDAPQGWSLTAEGAASGDRTSAGFNSVTCTSGGAKVKENLPTAMGQELMQGISLGANGMPDIKTAPDVRMAEYTASGNHWGLGGPVHGYRATLGGTRLIASVTCQCSESDWPKIRPAFAHVLASIHQTALAEKTVSADPLSGSSSVLSPVGGM